MREYQIYVAELETLAMGGEVIVPQVADPALNGAAGRELARTVSLHRRRRYGAFFTGSELANKLVGKSRFSGTVCDPACGAGDLLIAAARKLPLRRGLRSTLQLWGAKLLGVDVHPAFVRAAKARLVVLARIRGKFWGPLDERDLRAAFPGLKVGNAFDNAAMLKTADVVLMNPPFVAVAADENCPWAAGLVNSAAKFVDFALQHTNPGARLIALLPEVLRVGTRYDKWRLSVAGRARVEEQRSLGLFDSLADVDVFLLRAQRTAAVNPAQKGSRRRRKGAVVLGDRFSVRVGPLVPFRHKERGVVRRYLHARLIENWTEKKRIEEKRRFQGTVFAPPFVVVKRTSRPGDKFRAAAAVILGHAPVAVENHLIVCMPSDGTVQSCRELMGQLKKERTNRWLNRRIRCRHLTVRAVLSLPVA